MIGAELEKFRNEFLLATERLVASLAPSEALGAAISSWADEFEAAQKKIRDSVLDVFNSLDRALEGLPARSKNALRVSARHGWYMDPEMSFPGLFDVVELFEAGSVNEANWAMSSHFERRLGSIERSLSLSFPHRSRFIAAAVAAHRQGAYVLSVPVLLAQADGICQDKVGVQLYSRRRLSSLASAFESDTATAIRSAILSPLLEEMPITESIEGWRQRGDALNRHAILHGVSIDYDTELNSVKALSLLNYVEWVVKVRMAMAIYANLLGSHLRGGAVQAQRRERCRHGNIRSRSPGGPTSRQLVFSGTQ